MDAQPVESCVPCGEGAVGPLSFVVFENYPTSTGVKPDFTMGFGLCRITEQLLQALTSRGETVLDSQGISNYCFLLGLQSKASPPASSLCYETLRSFAVGSIAKGSALDNQEVFCLEEFRFIHIYNFLSVRLVR